MMDVSEIVPFSLWERILKEPNISANDIFSFCSSCKRFHEFILQNSSLWRVKVGQRWPSLKRQLENRSIKDWEDIYHHRYTAALETQKFLNGLAARYIREEVVVHLSYTAFKQMKEYADRCEKSGLFLIDEFRFILNDTPSNTRLTDKYYATGAIRYLVHERMIPRWHQWLEGGRLLEVGAWLLAEWFTPSSYLDERILTNQLNLMVQQTKIKLAQINKHHPLLRSGFIDHANLHETIWGVVETREVIESLNHVFTAVNGFRGNASDYYNMNNSFLNEVIQSKLGIPITLCILYHAVARRLGVYCAPVNFPSHFLLKFLDHPELSSESHKYTYIDVFNSCRLMQENQVWANHAPPSLAHNRSFFNVPDSISVLVRMLTNIAHVDERYQASDLVAICSAWELGVILNPTEFDMRFLLARMYFRLDINVEKVLELMEGVPEPNDVMRRAQRQHYIEMAKTKLIREAVYNVDDVVPPAPKLRSMHPHVKHAVGMIMRHKQYHYTCVISGWDPICAAAENWKIQMGVQNLPKKDQQPFYHVLVNDGSNRYAAEENLIFEPNPQVVDHPEIGRFFQEYSGKMYTMNDERKRDYPEDESAAIENVEHFHLANASEVGA